MIILETNQIILGEVEERIVRWETWFHTPWGLCKDVFTAVGACKKQEIDPESAIVPVPVAIGQSVYEAYRGY